MTIPTPDDAPDNLQDADTLADFPASSDLPDRAVPHSEDDIDPPATTDGVRGVDPPMSGESEPTSDRATGITTLRG